MILSSPKGEADVDQDHEGRESQAHAVLRYVDWRLRLVAARSDEGSADEPPSRLPTGIRPFVKSYARRETDASVTLVSDAGVEFELDDPEGQVRALLETLDGTRTIDDAVAALQARWPELTKADLAAGVTALDEAGLLEDAAAPPGLSPWQEERYASNLSFFGTFASLSRSRYTFQHALRRARVVLLGVGGLGSTLLYNLAGMGVGRVTLVDHDRVELKNLARQFLYDEADVGKSKVERAARRARRVNSEVEVSIVETWVDGPETVARLLPAELVLAAIDRPSDVRDWINEACVQAGVPFITGGFQAHRGLYQAVAPKKSGCLACARRDASRTLPAELVNRGIGPVATLVGSFMSLEALRFLTGFAPPVAAGRLWLVDFPTGRAELAFEWDRDPACPVCGD